MLVCADTLDLAAKWYFKKEMTITVTIRNSFERSTTLTKICIQITFRKREKNIIIMRFLNCQ